LTCNPTSFLIFQVPLPTNPPPPPAKGIKASDAAEWILIYLHNRKVPGSNLDRTTNSEILCFPKFLQERVGILP
jgi:hypothetical protein